MDAIRPDAFNEVLHSAPRITIMSRLAIHRAMRFAPLQKSTTLTAGNLAAHLRLLDQAGYVAMESMPNSVSKQRSVKITSRGDEEFRSYVAHMMQVFGNLSAPDGATGEPTTKT